MITPALDKALLSVGSYTAEGIQALALLAIAEALAKKNEIEVLRFSDKLHHRSLVGSARSQKVQDTISKLEKL